MSHENMTENQIEDLREQMTEMTDRVGRLVDLLEGDKNRPGILVQHRAHHEALFGDPSAGKPGLIHQMNSMWKLRTWAMCSGSGALGVIFGVTAKAVIERIL